MNNLRPIILAIAAVLIGIVIFAGFGTNIASNIPAPAAPPELQDGIPVLKGGVIDMRVGRTERFYAEGRVTLRNDNVGYCLSVAPPDTFNMTHTGGGRIVYIEPKSGERTLAVVITKPRADCD